MIPEGIQKFEELLDKDSSKPSKRSNKRHRTKNEILKINEDLIATFKNLPESDDVFLVASFNHWFPVKMTLSHKKKLLLRDDRAKKAHLQKQLQ